MKFIIFFTYGDNYTKGTTIISANSRDDAKDKFMNYIDKDDYKNLHIWWSDELDNMLIDDDGIIVI